MTNDEWNELIVERFMPVHKVAPPVNRQNTSNPHAIGTNDPQTQTEIINERRRILNRAMRRERVRQ